MSATSDDREDFQVLVSLRKLLQLLEYADNAENLASKVDSLERQLSALRGQFYQLMEKYKELK